MTNKKRADIRTRISKLGEELNKEKAELDYLAGETIKMGRTLASDESLLRQNDKVNELIVEVYHLKEMLDEFDEEEDETESALHEDKPEDD